MALENIINKVNALLGGLAVVASLAGCASSQKQAHFEADVAKYSLAANMAAGYFGALGTHEGGHALTAALVGANSIDVSVLPQKHNGLSTLGYTSYERATPLRGWEESAFNVSGPGVNLAAGIAARELLKTGEAPAMIQPTLQWYALGNKILFYWEAVNGIAGTRGSDLSKERPWVPATMLGFEALCDVVDILITDSPSKYLGVLSGSSFYEPEEKRFSIELWSTKEERYAGIRMGW